MKDIPGTKHIYRKQYDYSIDKHENGKTIHYISCKSLIQALMIRDLLVVNDWNRSVIPEVNFLTKSNEKYISPASTGGYFIHKRINGDDVYFDYCRTLEQAIHERDLLVKYDWDIELVCENNEEILDGESWLKGKLSTKNQIYFPPNGRIDYDKELIHL